MLIHGPGLGRQKQNIDSVRSTNEKSMGVRSSSALQQSQGSGERILYSNGYGARTSHWVAVGSQLDKGQTLSIQQEVKKNTLWLGKEMRESSSVGWDIGQIHQS